MDRPVNPTFEINGHGDYVCCQFNVIYIYKRNEYAQFTTSTSYFVSVTHEKHTFGDFYTI